MQDPPSAGHLSEFSVFHSYRNRIWLFAKNTPWPLLLPIFGLQSAAIALALARPRARRYRRAGLRGVWAGVKGLPGSAAEPKEDSARRDRYRPGTLRG